MGILNAAQVEPAFVAFEGGEGCGKSTQAAMLGEALRAAGCDVLLTREPGGTFGAEAIRTLLLDPPDGDWNLRAEALLFAAARSDHVERAIRPALTSGAWVICDRFVGSSLAYQGIAGGIDTDNIAWLHEFGSAGLLPDITFLIETSEATARARRAERGHPSDAIEQRDAEFHRRVRTGFRSVADAALSRWVTLDGEQPASQLHDDVLAHLGLS